MSVAIVIATQFGVRFATLTSFPGLSTFSFSFW